MVGRSELDDDYDHGTGKPVNSYDYYMDRAGEIEHNVDRFIRASKRGVERIRR